MRTSQEGSVERAILLATVFLGLALSVGMVLFGAMTKYGIGNQISVEIAKAGLQLGVVSILGGSVAVILRRLESGREQRRILNEYRLNLLRDVTYSYNRVKAVRRTLRAFGFDNPMGKPLTADQVKEFHEQMKALNEAQLSLERLKREVKVRSLAIGDSKEIEGALESAEKYIGEVLEDWEKNGLGVVVGAIPTAVISMAAMQRFLGDADLGFKTYASEPMALIQNQIWSQSSRIQ
jgi:hypothetical protein